MAINYGQNSNYQDIAAQGQRILMELLRARQQAEQQKSAQTVAMLTNAAEVANRNISQFGQMRFQQQERAAERASDVERTRLQQEGYTQRVGQELKAREDLARKAVLAKMGYVDRADVTAEDQFNGDFDLFQASNPNASPSDFAAQQMARAETVKQMNEFSIKATGEPLQQAMMRAQQSGLDLPTYFAVRTDKDPHRGWGVSPEALAAAQQKERHYQEIQDDPEYQDADGQQALAELRGQINALYQPTVYAREKEPTIAELFDQQAMMQIGIPGLAFRQTGKNSGVVTHPDGSGAIVQMQKNRSTGQMELQEVSTWAAPKPDKAQEAMNILELPAEDIAKLVYEEIKADTTLQALLPEQQADVVFKRFAARDAARNKMLTEAKMGAARAQAWNAMSQQAQAAAAESARLAKLQPARPQQIVTTQPAAETLEQIEAQLGAIVDRYPNIANMPDNERARYEDLKRKYIAQRGQR